jgi:hypothetical protein
MACADVHPQLQLTTSMITRMKYDNLRGKKKFNIDLYMAELHKQEAISNVETISIHSDSDEEYERIETVRKT